MWGAVRVLEGEIMLFYFAFLGNMGGGRGEKVN